MCRRGCRKARASAAAMTAAKASARSCGSSRPANATPLSRGSIWTQKRPARKCLQATVRWHEQLRVVIKRSLTDEIMPIRYHRPTGYECPTSVLNHHNGITTACLPMASCVAAPSPNRGPRSRSVRSHRRLLPVRNPSRRPFLRPPFLRRLRRPRLRRRLRRRGAALPCS